MAKITRIAITTGDADGIGSEVSAKALNKIKPQKGVLFYFWRSPSCPKKHLAKIDSSFKRITVTSWPEALKVTPSSYKEMIDVCSSLSPANWVEVSAAAAFHGHIDAIATAPISKTSIQAAGLKDVGHTDILKRVAQVDRVFMSFIGKQFSVVLATGHIPLHEISKKLTVETLIEAVHAANQLRKILPSKKQKLPIAIVGLNPHAGEHGMLGEEEDDVYTKAIKKLTAEKIPVIGPLVPDAAFKQKNWAEYSVYVASYHDQGLIPFKMVHGESSGIQISMGLPFVRTSVDHGTAKTLFNKNKADSGSMQEALRWAVSLSKLQNPTSY